MNDGVLVVDGFEKTLKKIIDRGRKGFDDTQHGRADLQNEPVARKTERKLVTVCVTFKNGLFYVRGNTWVEHMI